MPEREAVCQKLSGYNAAALDDQFGFSTHEKRPNLQQPAWRRQAEWSATNLANRSHEFPIRHRIWRGKINCTREVLVFHYPLHCEAEILDMNPRNKLSSSCHAAAEAKPC